MIKIGYINSTNLPVVIEPADNLKSRADSKLLNFIVADRYDFLYKNLLQHGAILFRGFRVQDIAAFEDFVRRFSGKGFFNYAGGVSPRVLLSGNVYSSTEYPPHLRLQLHNELSYSETYPRHLYFCCLTAPKNGGETTLGDSRRILKKINPKIIEKFKTKKIRYDRFLSADKGSGYSWQEAFETENKYRVEKLCRKIGAEFQWKKDGSLLLSQIRPPTAIHPETGEEVWFNQADGFHPSNLDKEAYNALIKEMPERDFRLNAYCGDGSPISLETLTKIRKTLQKETVLLQWQTGDVLILDNLLSAHGRMPFTGKRKIALAMT